MRGLGLLAALLPLSAPALARPSSNNALSLPTIAYITLDSPWLPVAGEDPQYLQFWLQLHPSAPVCSAADLFLVNHRLDAVSPAGTLFSSFGRGRRASFDAAWTIDCPPAKGPDAALERTALITVYAVNSTAPGNNRQFAVNFRQSASHPEIVSVHGAAHRLVSVVEDVDLVDEDLYPVPGDHPEPEAPEFLTELGLKHTFAVAKEKIQLLERLSDPEKMKAWREDHGMLPPSTTPILHVDDPPASPLAEDEDDDEYTPPTMGHDQESTHAGSNPSDRYERPLAGGSGGYKSSASSETTSSRLSKALSNLLQDQDVTIILGAALVFFSLFVFLLISFLRNRQQVKSEDGTHRRRWSHSARQHESTAERLARHYNRRQARVEAIKGWWGGFIGRLFAIQEKDGMPSQQVIEQEIQARAAPVQTRARPQTPVPTEDDDETTMEQDLAQFREAAALVGNLIAAEEGIPQRMAPRHSMPPRHRPRLSMESDGFNSEDEPLPTYEELAPSSMAVQDGFRYTPDTPPADPAANSAPESPDSNNSDRLGYNK
jgi:hypothetical protein